MRDDPSRLDRSGRWPTDDAVYYLILKSRVQLGAQEPRRNATFNDPLSEMMALQQQCPRLPTCHGWLKLMTQMRRGIAMGLIESCNAYEYEIAQNYLKTADESGDLRAFPR
eukprot:6882439-Pyramimonas_sp.AAC.1